MRFSRIDHTYRVLELMKEYRIPMNEITYEYVISRMIAQDNLELAMQWLAEMGKEDLPPTLTTVQSLIKLAASKSHSRLAIDLAVSFELSTPRILDGETWYQCLIAAGDSLYVRCVVISESYHTHFYASPTE
jgi:hypothetical protein